MRDGEPTHKFTKYYRTEACAGTWKNEYGAWMCYGGSLEGIAKDIDNAVERALHWLVGHHMKIMQVVSFTVTPVSLPPDRMYHLVHVVAEEVPRLRSRKKSKEGLPNEV